MSHLLELVVLVEVIGVVGMALYLISMVKSSVWGGAFAALGLGVALSGFSRLFLFLGSVGFYSLGEESEHLWWHLIFIMGMLAFIYGSRKLLGVVRDATSGITRGDVLVEIGLFVAAIMIFFVAQPLERIMQVYLADSIIDRYGINHLVAMILSFVAVVTVWRVKRESGQVLGSGLVFVVAYLVLMVGLHMWEATTESWGLISVGFDTIELIEQLILVPAFLALGVGILRISLQVKRMSSWLG